MDTPYATPTVYRDVYLGGFAGSDSDLERLIMAATRQIDGLTLRRARGRTLTLFQQEMLCRACCLQVDFLAENGGAPGPVRSMKAFDVSVTFAPGGEWFSVEGKVALREAGLLGRALEV